MSVNDDDEYCILYFTILTCFVLIKYLCYIYFIFLSEIYYIHFWDIITCIIIQVIYCCRRRLRIKSRRLQCYFYIKYNTLIELSTRLQITKDVKDKMLPV